MDQMAPESAGEFRRGREQLRAIITRLETEARRRVDARQSVEKRWKEDLEAYHGIYDAQTRENLQKGGNSQLFINLTRPKTDAMAARLIDLLFPTDERNWGLTATPVPKLTSGAKEARRRAKAAMQQAEEQGVPPEAQPEIEEAEAAARELEAQIEAAQARALLMEQVIEDQLVESRYAAVMRDVIEDACKIGTGVCKGPVTGSRVRKGWVAEQAYDPMTGEAEETYRLDMAAEDQPAIRYVDPWGFFPDPDARTVEEGEGVYQRHLLSAKKMREMARLPGFDEDAIRNVLKAGPKSGSLPSYLNDLHFVDDHHNRASDRTFQVWEYSGPLAPEDMRFLAEWTGEPVGEDEADPLQETNAIVWFCSGEILKFSIYPYDSGECLYSVFNLGKAEQSCFGYGIPSMMRDPQRSLNSAWRAMMDNAGLATGPQILIAQDLVEPLDGDWTLRPRKMWVRKAGQPQDRLPFQTFDIPMRQQEIANIIALSSQFIDAMTSMPAVTQGEQGAGVTRTAQGMAILMNSANVVFRRFVKQFDDDVTTPIIRRYFDWNMQFNPDASIKGDMSVDARGSSVLLVREMQAQNLMFVAMQIGSHPEFGPMLKKRDVLKKLFQTQMIPSEDVLLTEEQIDKMMAEAAALPPDPMAEIQAATLDIEREKLALEREKLEAQIQIENMRVDAERDKARLAYDQKQMALVEGVNAKRDEIAARAAERQADRDIKARQIESEEAIVAAEAAMTDRFGPTAGGRF